ncbi:MAG: glutamine synthetase family protein [Acidimicrobiales bacterium]
MDVDRADALPQTARDAGVHSLRVCFADQHGLLHTKTVPVERWSEVVRDGIAMPASLLAKDTGNTYAIGLWAPSGLRALDELVGARDMVLRPDPATFRVLPWAAGVGMVLCELTQADGAPIELCTRSLCRRAVDQVHAAGYRLRIGLELELHLFELEGGAPIHPGWELLGERHADLVHDRLEPIRRGLAALGLPPRSVEVELGPGQIELSFAVHDALDAADAAVLVRSAVHQLARRNGLRASFACRPSADSFPSGWHLHQSLRAVADGGAANALVGDDGALLAPVGERWLAGLLDHAAASCLLTTPTVNGYKRYRPNSVAPDRIAWSRQHRGAMVRLIGGGADPATHFENRVADPAANPYLAVASQAVSGLDGLRRQLHPPPITDSPYRAEAGPLLPRSLGEAIDAFAGSPLYRAVWGDDVVDYLLAIKRSEWSRFLAAVTDWELREYGGF